MYIRPKLTFVNLGLFLYQFLNKKREEEMTMKTYCKSAKLDNVCYDIRGPVLEEADKMIARGEKILKLNIGNPAPFHFNAPQEIINDMIYNLHDSEGYSDSRGIFSARKAIMQYCQLKGIKNVDINDIYTGNGVSELIVMCMQGLLNNGDEILVPAPDYPLWTASITLAGGNAVHYQCDEQSEWYPDINDIKKKITDKTKGIVIINPNNPTGALYPESVLKEIAEVARQNELILFADEIYDRLVMDGLKHTSIAALAPDIFCITLNGLSKSHRVAGFRSGWMVLSGPKEQVRGYIEGINMLSSMRLCSNVPSQQIIQTALGGYQSADELLLPGGRIYEQREYIYNALNDIPGISAVKPKAAFYIFPKIDTERFHITDDEKFVLDLLREKKILLVHGRGFNWMEPDHFRIVYLPNIDDLQLAMSKFRNFLQGYQQS
ncbi:alanine-synthesizing transaminase [Anaerocolumna jejuensis DSM 15929]|uniref:alanine transaminase n=2 Tax=Anaerocolumna TaxID=1843210 RepID=A0A1M6V630_9FIRM|nr:alanine-synthesizing transaminase [Anaerocolumna jejuensis DSM 15929]